MAGSAREAPAAKPSITITQPTDRYRYVASDLRRTGVIAGVFFVILIVLRFVLR